MASNYLAVKLDSGDEIMGKIEGSVMLSPALIIIREQENGGMGCVLVPFMPYSKNGSIDIPAIDMLPQCEVLDGVLEQYKKMFEPSAIITPPKNIITK